MWSAIGTSARRATRSRDRRAADSTAIAASDRRRCRARRRARSARRPGRPSARRLPRGSVLCCWRRSGCSSGRATSTIGTSANSTAMPTDAASTAPKTTTSRAISPCRGISGGMLRDEQRQRDAREQEPGDRAGRREHGLFDDELPNQAQTGRAERGAQRDLLCALDRATEHQRAEVDRRQQQNQADRAEQDQERWLQRRRHRCPAAIRRGSSGPSRSSSRGRGASPGRARPPRGARLRRRRRA